MDKNDNRRAQGTRNFGLLGGHAQLGPIRRGMTIRRWVPSSPLDPGHFEYVHEEQVDIEPIDTGGDSGNRDIDTNIGSGGSTGKGSYGIWNLPIRYELPERPPSPNIQCEERKVLQILAAFNRLIDSPCFACLPELRDCMIKSWESGIIRIVCRDFTQEPCSLGEDARTNGTYQRDGYIIDLCDNIWDKFEDLPIERREIEKKQFRYLMDVLIHEMTHLCTQLGTEVEALAVQYLCNPDTSTSGPTIQEWDDFEFRSPPALIGVDIVRVGKYVAVDPQTGKIWSIDPVTKAIRKLCSQDDRLIRR